MKVLVIGGNRFFGIKLVNLLAEAGHDVTVANRGSKPDLFSAPIKSIKVDRSDEDAMNQAFNGTTWDLVYDQICSTKEEAEIAVRVFSGKVKNLIFTSTASVYSSAANRDESFFDAATFNFTDKSENEYQHGKRSAEKVYLDAPFPVISVRIPVVVGLDDYKMRMHWHIKKIMKKEPIFFPNIEASYSFIQSDEAAEFLFWLHSKDSITGPINASSLSPVKLIDFIRQIEDCCWERTVYSDEADASNHSPYGVDQDCTLSVKKATDLGFQFSDSNDWFNDLVEEICDSYNSWKETI